VLQADQRASKLQEAEQDLSAPLVADLQPPVTTSQASDRSTT
jgi:hypothetical protein